MIFFPSWSTRILQARRLRPLISIASEPQMPWPHERRNVSVSSISALTRWRRLSTRSIGCDFDRVALPVGRGIPLGIEAEDPEVDLHALRSRAQ